MYSFEDKVVVVTGAGTGIGEAVARGFVEAGARVAFVGRRAEKLAEAASGLAEERVLLNSCDVADRAAVDTLVARTLKAAKSERVERIVVAGGVGANSLLREELSAKFEGRVFYPRLEYCTDNGAMIAVAGALRLADAQKPATIHAMARWSLDSLTPPQSEQV